MALSTDGAALCFQTRATACSRPCRPSGSLYRLSCCCCSPESSDDVITAVSAWSDVTCRGVGTSSPSCVTSHPCGPTRAQSVVSRHKHICTVQWSRNSLLRRSGDVTSSVFIVITDRREIVLQIAMSRNTRHEFLTEIFDRQGRCRL